MEWFYYLWLYLTLNFVLSLYVYKDQKVFYSKEHKDIHEKYEAFKRNDRLSYLRLLIGLNLFFWVKFLSLILVAITLCLTLSVIRFINKNLNDSSPRKRRHLKLVIKNFLTLTSFLCGFRVIHQRKRCEVVYERYFGKDYDFEFDDGYSSMICNHASWMDIVITMAKFAPGFISKDEMQNVPLIGIVAKQINCLFVKREDSSNRTEILQLIEKRQCQFMNKVFLHPLLVFPEGTVTSGNHILRLKKGVFNSLLPVKPVMIIHTLNDNFHLATGALGALMHLIRTLCYLYHDVHVIEIPVIKPNEFMFQNFRTGPNQEKWEIYSDVVREIYCNVGGYSKSDMTLRDSNDYLHQLRGKVKLNILKEKVKIS